MIRWTEKTVSVAELRPYERNPRIISDAAYERLKASLKENGYHQRIIAQPDLRVIGGHQRFRALKELGIDEVQVLVPSEELTEAQFRRILIQDNLPFGTFNLEMLAADFTMPELTAWGMPDEWLKGFGKPTEGLCDPDAIPPAPAEPISVCGDVWTLGGHRLMCGDSTKAEDVAKLMDGKKADICFTSPPYNCGSTPNGNKSKYKNDADNKSHIQYLNLLNQFTRLSLEYSDYVFCNVQSLSGNKLALIDYLYELKDKYADTIIWDKKTAEPAMARRVLNSRFEYIHIFSNEGKRTVGKRDFRGTLENIFIQNSKKDKSFSDQHKATFPISVPQYFIENFSNNSIYDPFSGSGTTIIAAEMTGRKCLAMEISENYVDLACLRFMAFTGKEARHAETGQLFSEVSSARQTDPARVETAPHV